MGINTHYYTILGYKHDGYDSDLGEIAYENKIDLLGDGMAGEYQVIGKIIGVSHDFRWEDGDGDNFIAIEPSELANIEQKYKEKFKKKMPEEYHHYVDHPFKLYVILHYS